MNKSFFKIFGVLFILLFQFTSCLKDDNGKPVYFFYDEPVIVDSLDEHPIVRNQSYSFYVPGLIDNKELNAGDLLWTSFIVDLDDNKYPGSNSNKPYTAQNFKYETVDSVKVIIPANKTEFESYLSDDYTAPIELASLYRYAIDSLWFFGFKQKDQSNRLLHTYELILNPEIEQNSNNLPTLYIRSKLINSPAADQGTAHSKDGKIFAFDVAEFVHYYRKEISSTGLVRFNLKYKTGEDSNGKDIYRSFISNPISWNFSSRKS